MENRFEAPKKIQQILNGYQHLWMVAGGWAIDLFLNRETRTHHDIEIAIPRKDQLKIKAYLADWNLQCVQSHQFYDWEHGHFLELPIHEIHGQFKEEKIEVLLNEIEGDTWKFRRVLEIEYPLSKTVLISATGIPILAPEIVLLYKAKNPRTKDHSDFLQIIGLLDSEKQQWLKAAIKRTHGNLHDWLKAIN